jgi:hypothetical protein
MVVICCISWPMTCFPNRLLYQILFLALNDALSHTPCHVHWHTPVARPRPALAVPGPGPGSAAPPARPGSPAAPASRARPCTRPPSGEPSRPASCSAAPVPRFNRPRAPARPPVLALGLVWPCPRSLALACPGMLARPPRRALLASCRPLRGLELGPACLWRAALSSASTRPRRAHG